MPNVTALFPGKQARSALAKRKKGGMSSRLRSFVPPFLLAQFQFLTLHVALPYIENNRSEAYETLATPDPVR